MSVTSPLPWPARRTFAAGLAASLFFALYGSLVPFDLRELPLADAWRQYRAVWRSPLQIMSRSDVIANVLLMMPAAFFAMGLLRLDRRGRRASLAALLATIVGGALYAAGLEFSQLFTPDRIVSPSDVLAQTLGAALGATIWLLAGQPFVDWMRGTLGGRHHAGHRRLHAALALYAIGWLLAMALPLNLSLSPAEIVRKYREGGIILTPFGGTYASASDVLWATVSSLLAAVPLGTLGALTMAAFMPARAGARDGSETPWGAASLAIGAAFVLGGEIVQLLVAERRFDSTDLLLGFVGAATGVWLAHRLVVVQAVPADAPTPSRARTSVAAAAGLCCWIVLLAFYHWKPFDFSADVAQARGRLAQLSLMPLRQYQWESGTPMLTQALVKSGLGLPLGIGLAAVLRPWWSGIRSAGRLRVMAAVLFTLPLFIVLEAGQLFLPGRVPNTTDIWLGFAGAMAGYGIASGLAMDLHPWSRRDCRQS